MQSISFKHVEEINGLLAPMTEEGASLQVSIDSRSDSGVMYVLEGIRKGSAEMHNLFPPMCFWEIKDLLTMMYRSGMYQDYIEGGENTEIKHKGINTLEALGLVGNKEFIVTGAYPDNNHSLASFRAIQIHTKFGDFKIRVSDNNSSLRVSSGDQISVYPSASNVIEIISHE